MKEKKVMNKDKAIGFGVGLLTGAVIGGVVALLYAPQSGKETRQLIKDKVTNVGWMRSREDQRSSPGTQKLKTYYSDNGITVKLCKSSSFHFPVLSP